MKKISQTVPFIFSTILLVFVGCQKVNKSDTPEIIRGVWSHRIYHDPSYVEYLQFDKLASTYTFEKNLIFIDDYNYQKRDKYHLIGVDTRDSQDSTIYILTMYKWIGLKKDYETRSFCYKKDLNRLDVYILNDDGSLTKGDAYYEKVN